MTILQNSKFLDDVKNHKMKVINDRGISRHLVFSDVTGSMLFNIITFRGYLVYCGDMGEFMFSGYSDMFDLFQDIASISPPCWGDRVIATGTDESVREWDKEKFEKNVLGYLEEDGEIINQELLEEVKSQILCYSDKEADALTAVDNFSSDVFGYFEFYDFFEKNNESYSRRFVWCCHAIRWGIEQYQEKRDAIEKRRV